MATSTLARMSSARRTTVALKLLMALTGLLFVLYLLAHMYGNLKIFSGAAAFDEYSHHLRVLGEPLLPEKGFLWVLRIVLLLSLAGHAYAAFALWRRAGKARGTRYTKKKAVQATLSSRTMRWGGVALLAFVVFHVLHFTTNTIQLNGGFESPAQRVLTSFQTWYGVLIYLVAMVALAMHLRHGIWGASMTLGWNTSRAAARNINIVAITVAAVIFVGFMVPPLAILFRFVG